ncbi:MAG: hypothetical protein ACUVUD_03370 [bacterium]
MQSFVHRLGRESDSRLIKLFTKSAWLEVVGLGVVAQGRRELAEFLGYARVVNLKLLMSDLVLKGDTIVCRLEESNDWLHLAGIESMLYEARFVIVGGKIDRVIVEPIEDILVMLMKGPLFSFSRWLKTEEADMIERLMPDGKFRFTPQNGCRLIELMCRWRGIN